MGGFDLRNVPFGAMKRHVLGGKAARFAMRFGTPDIALWP